MDNNSHVPREIAKILLGGGIIALAVWKLPIVEMFYLFVMIVVLPLIILTSVGVISTSTLNLIMGGPETFRTKVEDAMNEYRTKGYRDQAASA